MCGYGEDVVFTKLKTGERSHFAGTSRGCPLKSLDSGDFRKFYFFKLNVTIVNGYCAQEHGNGSFGANSHATHSDRLVRLSSSFPHTRHQLMFRQRIREKIHRSLVGIILIIFKIKNNILSRTRRMKRQMALKESRQRSERSTRLLPRSAPKMYPLPERTGGASMTIQSLILQNKRENPKYSYELHSGRNELTLAFEQTPRRVPGNQPNLNNQTAEV